MPDRRPESRPERRSLFRRLAGRPAAPAPMSINQYLGELMLVPYNFVPLGFLECNGQLVSLSEYDALFSLLGTRYGGDGTATFGLPDLRGRSVVGTGTPPGGTELTLGQVGGTQTVTLTAAQMPAHTHAGPTVAVSSAVGTTADPTGATLARPASDIPTYAATADAALAAGTLSGTVAAAGGGGSFDNRDPYLGLTYCIATEGIYPSQA